MFQTDLGGQKHEGSAVGGERSVLGSQAVQVFSGWELPVQVRGGGDSPVQLEPGAQ